MLVYHFKSAERVFQVHMIKGLNQEHNSEFSLANDAPKTEKVMEKNFLVCLRKIVPVLANF
jgi:hypothetical protein